MSSTTVRTFPIDEQVTLADLLTIVAEISPGIDTTSIKHAYAFAEERHLGLMRKSGEPYIIHPLHVAVILANMQMDPESITAALLHDVLEDTDATHEEIEEQFGARVANLVEGVTKLSRIPVTGDQTAEEKAHRESERQAESTRKMFLAMADDVRVVLIKLADRLHNMRTLQFVSPESQRRIAQQTMDIYAPLANRLGIWQIKSELEDLSFRYLDPQTYHSIQRALDERGGDRERAIATFMEQLQQALTAEGVTAEISGRTKHIYSIWRKMQRKEVRFDEIYDVMGVRIIVGEHRDCYAALGVVHQLWRPVPSEFDDYIANPKESQYKSIHTAVLGVEGHPIEIQIRTREMHFVAEYGIAAHWRYKEGRRVDQQVEAKVQWLRQLMDWRDEVVDAQEFMESVRTDVLQELVYVLTPRGDIIELPKGATPLDFAYRIHTEVGHQCVGAKVNDELVPLNTPLNNGQVVRIMTSKNKLGPSRDWLLSANGYVTTASAREKVRQWFRRQARDENIAQGREMLERELRRLGIDAKLDDIAKHFAQFQRPDDLLAALGYGGISPQHIVNKLVESREPEVLGRTSGPPREVPEPKLQVMGVGDLYTRLATCCRPVFGDDIVGYVTRGRGITVHRRDCHNVKRVDDEARLVAVSWGERATQMFPVDVRLDAWDRVGLVRDITTVIADERINMINLQTLVNMDRTVLVKLTLEVSGVGQLARVLTRLESVREIYDVRRDTSVSGSDAG